MFFDFDWDAKKARSNLAKHGVSLRLATAVFRDPRALTIFDDEDRWITLGRAQNGQVLTVVHTSKEIGATGLNIRILSARRADPTEVCDYEQSPR